MNTPVMQSPPNRRSLRVLTNSELKTRRRCAREHHYSYELGIRSAREDAAALRFGTLIHRALEAWWKTLDRSERFAAALATLPLDGDPFELQRAIAMLQGYDIRWRDEPLDVLHIAGVPAVETEFRAPLINPLTSQVSRTFVLGGKMDVLALHTEDCRVYIVEHKTSSDDISDGSDYWRHLTIDTQISTYVAGARALGFDPAGVIYDVLGKPQLRPLKATPREKRKTRKDGEAYAYVRLTDETPEEFGARVTEAIAAEPDRYFRRGMVVRFEEEEREAQWDAWQDARSIRDAELAQRWPRNPDACRRFNRMCSYFGVCSKVASLDDPEMFRRVTNVHEELSPEGLANDNAPITAAADGGTTTH